MSGDPMVVEVRHGTIPVVATRLPFSIRELPDGPDNGALVKAVVGYALINGLATRWQFGGEAARDGGYEQLWIPAEAP